MTKQQCRCCLTTADLISIYSKKQKPKIYTKIMKLTKVRVHPGDGLPGKICSTCLIKLNNCVEFINICEASEVKLRQNIKMDYDIHSISNREHCNDIFNDKNEIFKSIPQLALKKSVLDVNEAMDINNLTKSEDIKTVLSIKTDCIKSSIDKKIEKQQCFTCGKVMSSRFRLKTHLRTHTGERPFSCPHCNKNFSLAQNLKVHLRTHTGEKPLQCTVCGESFAQSAGLAAHKRKHTGQTPYRCVLCPRSFRTIGHLQYHIRRHTGEKNFECDTCGRAFITRSDLKQHLLIHTGEKPHECSTCGLRLTRSSHLKRHILHMHNGLNPFNCTECPSTFTNRRCLEKHKKEHNTSPEIVEESCEKSVSFEDI